MARILIFGASTTYGKCDPDGGWAGRLRKHIDQRAENMDLNSVFNLGVSGDTTEDVIRRFEFETKQRIEEDEETVFIFGIGVNDAQFLHGKQGTKTPPEKFRKNIRSLIKMARKFSPKIVFLGLEPVDESRTDPWKPNKSYEMEHIEKYNGIIREVCAETNTHFIDKLAQSKQGNYKQLLYDGLHPNSEGHRKIFEIVRDFLNASKLI